MWRTPCPTTTGGPVPAVVSLGGVANLWCRPPQAKLMFSTPDVLVRALGSHADTHSGDCGNCYCDGQFVLCCCLFLCPLGGRGLSGQAAGRSPENGLLWEGVSVVSIRSIDIVPPRASLFYPRPTGCSGCSGIQCDACCDCCAELCRCLDVCSILGDCCIALCNGCASCSGGCDCNC